jgi:hypothetical protein
MQDTLTFTVRIHDPKEKKNPELSTAWAAVEVPREDLSLPKAEFIAKWIEPALSTMTKILSLT